MTKTAKMPETRAHYLGFLFILLLENSLYVMSQSDFAGPSSNTGIVTIDKSNLAIFTLSRNAGSGGVPVTLSATTAFESDVVVTCTTDAATVVGYTKITFTAGGVTISQAAVVKTGNVPFTINGNGEGRPVLVTCSGASTPVDPIHFPQFTPKENDTVFIQVTEPATVNFCSETITVPNLFGVTSDTFRLQFSDTVAVDSVTVRCTTCTAASCPNSNAPPFAAGTSLAITIPNKVAAIGSDNIDMTYSWTGSGSDVEIRCDGESANTGNQYLRTRSRGASAIFTFEKGSVVLFPPVQLVRSSKFQSELVLNTVLSNQAQEVTFDCTLEQFNDTSTLADAARNPTCKEISVIRVPTTNTTTAPTGAPVPTVATTAATTTNTSIQWTLKAQRFIFKEGQYYKTVEVERSSWPTSTTAELMLLSCCAPSGSNTSPKYINKTAAAIVLSYLEPNYEVNETAAALTTSSVETEIKNPAFVNLSPCPCDLLKGVCDVNCCCDTDCTEDMNKTMICNPGILGGERTNGPEDRTCETTRYYKEDWWMVTCVYYENNAYLGLYYNNQKGIRTKQAYTSTVPAKRSTFTWEEKDARNVAENVTGIGYKQGLSIQTKVPGSNGKVGILTLPQRVLAGHCQRTAPVQYLTDGSSNCNIKMTKATCEEVGGPFSARSYITASSISTPPCPSYPGVMMQYDGSAFTTVSTNYFCTSDPNLRGYVKNLEDVETVPTRSLFSTTIVDYASCEFDKHGQFVCPNSTTVTPPAAAAPARCTYDDSLNLPPKPTFDATTKICRNAVLDVEYKFYWAGKKIVNLTANYILGDVPADMSYTKTIKTYSTDATGAVQETQTVLALTYPSEVTQKYSIKFSHDYNFTLLQNANADATDSTGQYSPRSGYPGYEVRKPIIAGIGYYNTTTNITEPVDYSQGNGIYYYKVDADGLCTTATKQPATYDEEVLSNCAIYLAVNDFDDCDELRKTTLLHLDSMMPANYLSQIGYVNDSSATTVDQHWVQIVRSNLSDTVFPEPMNETARNASIQQQILLTGYPNGTHDLFNVVDKIKGRCSSIPTGIHISIFSAYTGNINGREIHRIVGAKISYTLSTLEMRCVGSQGTACQNNSAETQRFTMTATVDFSDAATDGSYATRYNEFQGKCWEEKCNAQLFYPFTKYYTQEPYQYTLAWLLVFILFLVPTFLVTRPWW